MRCQRAQQLMNDRIYKDEAVDIKLAEHLRDCKSCSTHAAADRLISRAFNKQRLAEPDSETPLSFLKTRIESRASQQNNKEQRAMASFKHTLMGHPVMSFGFLGVLVVLVAMATVPVSCNRTVGYSVDVDSDNSPIANAITTDADGTASITLQRSADGKIMEFDSRQIVEALGALGISDVKLEMSANEYGQTFTVSGLQSREQARDALLAIVEVVGVGEKAELSTRQASVSGSLLEQCLAGIKELIFDSEGKTDEQVRAEITAVLEEAGVFDADVQYTTDADGQKMIFIGQGEEGDSTVIEQHIQWTEDDANGGMEFEGTDTSVVIDIQTDGNQQTVEVEKRITVGSDD